MSGNSRISRIVVVNRDMETIDLHLAASSAVEEDAEPEKGGGEKKSEWFELTALFLEIVTSM